MNPRFGGLRLDIHVDTLPEHPSVLPLFLRSTDPYGNCLIADRRHCLHPRDTAISPFLFSWQYPRRLRWPTRERAVGPWTSHETGILAS